MADNPKGPDNAATGGGSSQAPAPAPALGAESQILNRLEALGKKFEESDSRWTNLRSLHDRQMTELRQMLEARANAGQDAGSTDGDAASPERRGVDPYELAEMQERAIRDFKQDHPDWQTYWADIEAIGQDEAKSRPFVHLKRSRDGGYVPDYYASLAHIREHVELQRLRQAKANADPAAQAAQQNANQAKADAGAIGGSGASIPDDTFTSDAWKGLSYDEKVKKLVEMGMLEIDPRDPPGALRR